jgi:hypothetical protein
MTARSSSKSRTIANTEKITRDPRRNPRVRQATEPLIVV